MRRGNTKTTLVIALLLLGLACAPQSAAKPTLVAGDMTEVRTSSPLNSPEVKPLLTNLLVNSSDKESRLIFKGNAELSYTSFLEAFPPSIVIDFQASAAPEVLGSSSIDNGTVRRVEISGVPEKEGIHRAKIYLTEARDYHITRENNGVVVVVSSLPLRSEAVKPVTSPAAGAGKSEGQAERDAAASSDSAISRLTAVEFKPLGQTGGSRLSVSSTDTLDPKVVARDQGRTIILSFAKTSVPGYLVRPLDTRFFASAVDYINPSVSGDTVSFTVKLREPVPYHLSQAGSATYLDFDSSGIAPPKAPLPEAVSTKQVQPAGQGDASSSETLHAKIEPSEIITTTGQQYSGKRVTLDFQNADIHNILRLIGEVSGMNVVISDRVSGKVSLRLKNVPWDQALDIVLASRNLDKDVVGNVIRIDDAQVLLAEMQKRQTEKDIAAKAEEAMAVKMWTPKYASVDTMKTLLEKLKSDAGSLKVIGNDIIATDKKDILNLMDVFFEKNDKVSKQILIEARIVEALTDFTKSLGLNWGGTATDTDGDLGGLLGSGSLGGSTTLQGLFGTNNAVNLITPPATGLGLSFSFAGAGLDLNANLYAMETTGDGRIISAPRILANNDQQVYIKQGTSVPYETTNENGTTVTFKEAELNLTVTPHIEENEKIITMAITVTKDTPDYSVSTRNPPINTREASTKLMVKDGETVVIGGIIVDEKSKQMNRVPGLHRIPILGWLFKSYSVADSKVELLIFITANIIPVKI